VTKESASEREFNSEDWGAALVPCELAEARAELFSGGQCSPEADPLVVFAPHLRYNFAAGTRWAPFADLGGGVTASGITDHEILKTKAIKSSRVEQAIELKAVQQTKAAGSVHF
jgi:hypothetical protein